MPLAFTKSEKTLAVVRVLDASPRGWTVPYGALQRELGMDPQEEGRCYVDSARRILLRDKGRLYDCVPGEGIRWLTDEEVARRGPRCLRRLNRAARREVRRQRCLEDATALPQELSTRYYAHLSMLGLLAEGASYERVKQTERSVENNRLAGIDPKHMAGF
jgi:hypothetical protein